MGWLLIGEFAFGILIGLLTGLSKAKAAGTTLPLLFAFGGGSVVALSVGHSDETLSLLGKQLFCFSVAVGIGLLFGLSLRIRSTNNRIGLPVES